MKATGQRDLEDIPGSHDAATPGITNLCGRETIPGQKNGVFPGRNAHHRDGKGPDDLKEPASIV